MARTADLHLFGKEIFFEDLHTPQGLARVDALFQEYLQKHDLSAYEALMSYRCTTEICSDTLLVLAPWVEHFLSDIFGCTQDPDERQALRALYAMIAQIKKEFIQRRVVPALPSMDPRCLEQSPQKISAFLGETYTTERFATSLALWMANQEKHQAALHWAAHYTAWAMQTREGQKTHRGDPLFHLPRKHTGHPALYPFDAEPRDGFNHTDQSLSQTYAMDQAHTCLICHHRGKDSCASGMRDKNTGAYQRHALGMILEGCPLGQKISEMTWLKRQGFSIGALAVITLHNPMVAGTGHRICWDCARACIFQTQDPVDIPGVETQILHDVLALDWGFEIYALLTRWNPLKPKHFLPQDTSGYKVLVAGMGPAGMMLSHELLNAGHHVVGIDGLPIEPLPEHLIKAPIKRVQEVWVPLEDRRTQGVGGVMEYGITARWDKNLLLILRLLLERRQAFQCYGSVRLGGTLTLAQSFDRGFDHVALCLGAGRPHFPDLKGAELPGVRVASDFLMGLHTQEAFRWDTMVSMQLDLPLMVIGGGLTAVDTATEAQAFYIRQVERCVKRYDTWGDLSLKGEDKERFERWLDHGRAVQQERLLAKTQGRRPCFKKLIQAWGGVYILYRQGLQESPAYRINPQELNHAIGQGVVLWPHTIVEEILGTPETGVTHLRITQKENTKIVPCRTVLMATGLIPNVSLAQEEEDLPTEKLYFRPLDSTGPAHPLDSFTVLQKPDGRRVTFGGDLHPAFHGSVVKAMASSQRAGPLIDLWMRQRAPFSPGAQQNLKQKTSCHVHTLCAYPSWVELVVHAPLWVRNHRPGCFYRLQGVSASNLKSEPVALSPVSVDAAAGYLTFWITPCGASTHLLSQVQPSQKISIMGPTGQAFPIPTQPTSLLMIGIGSRVVSILNIGAAYRRQGHYVTLGVAQIPSDMRDHPLLKSVADEIVDVQSDTLFQSLEDLHQTHTKPGMHLVVAAPLRLQQEIQTLWGDTLCRGLIHAPLQCMMKGVCGQCIQRRQTGASGVLFFACEKTFHSPDKVDLLWNESRTIQNRAMETLNHSAHSFVL